MAGHDEKNSATTRRDQIDKARAQQQRAERTRKIGLAMGAGVLALVLAGVITFAVQDKNQQPQQTRSATAGTTLAPVWSGLTGQTVDGVAANSMEQLAYHIHAHLAIYVDGQPMTVPAGVGITTPWQTQTESDGSLWIDSGSHFYYLHTHTTDGIIHIESPTETSYKLGQFFAEWNQPLSTTQVGPGKGTVTTYVNGAKYAGDPAEITLNAHTVIQLDVGPDVAPAAYTFAAGL